MGHCQGLEWIWKPGHSGEWATPEDPSYSILDLPLLPLLLHKFSWYRGLKCLTGQWQGVTVASIYSSPGSSPRPEITPLCILTPVCTYTLCFSWLTSVIYVHVFMH